VAEGENPRSGFPTLRGADVDDLVNHDPNGTTSLAGIEFAIADLDATALDEPPDFGTFQIDFDRHAKSYVADELYLHAGESGSLGALGALEVHRVEGGRPMSGVTLAPDPRARGLALKELALRDADPWVLERLYNRVFGKKATAKLFFVAVAVDGSGKPPFVWPLNPETAADATKKIIEGESYKWTLGSGAPIYGPRVIRGGVAVSIVVAESKRSVRQVGDALSTIGKAFAASSDLTRLIAALAGPGGFAHELALEASAHALRIVGEGLKLTPDKTFGAYAGLFSATGSWRGKLRQEDRGTAIRLVEVLE
jgi:hypothetical protein